MSSSGIVLYGTDLSPCVRTVKLTLKVLNLDYEYKEVNLQAGEHLSEEYVKKNPQHTVPMLDDNGTFIWDSHAIAAYLVDKYAKSDELYPKDPLKRAVVDQRLHFETGVLFHGIFKQLQRALFKENATEVPKDRLAELKDAYALLEQFLAENPYVAGPQLTIADFSIVATVSTLHLSYCPVDATKYPKLSAWLARISALPFYEEDNLRGARLLADKIRSKLPKQFDKLWQKAFEDIKSGAGKQ